MSEKPKYRHVYGGSDLRTLILVVKTRGTVAFAFSYVLTLCFVCFTLFFAFNPNINPSSPWFAAILGSAGDGSPATDFGYGDRSQFIVRSIPIFQNIEKPNKDTIFNQNQTNPVASDWNANDPFAPAGQNQPDPSPAPAPAPETTNSAILDSADVGSPATDFGYGSIPISQNIENPYKDTIFNRNETNPFASDWNATDPFAPAGQNQPESSPAPEPAPETTNSAVKTEDDRFSAPIRSEQRGTMNGTGKTDESVSAPAKKRSNMSDSGSVESLLGCDLFDGDWVVDDSYPLYKPGSCLLIDEQFSCFSNGRLDIDYLKYKWKPYGCTLPRLDANRLLQMLKHKRLVFVGDSLNKNMWQSMVCILSTAVKDKRKVFEAHGRRHSRKEAEYSYMFKDYNFTVEFYVSPFLVQEREIKDKHGMLKERLRLDLMGKTREDYKGADILIFNTGHWWNHEKTSLGEDYYQQGSHVFDKLNVLEAFYRALKTWARWVNTNVDPKKSIVLFRGYSETHYSGRQWNSRRACDNETDPIKSHENLKIYPPKMILLEKVLKGMKTPVRYLNITRMTDYRKDGHPSVYRKKNIPDEERKLLMRRQDCNHWCLPGVPDAWNELLYAELLIKEHQQQY